MLTIDRLNSLNNFRPVTRNLKRREQVLTINNADQIRFGKTLKRDPLTYEHIGTKKDSIMGDVEMYQFSNGIKFYGIQRKEFPIVSYAELFNTGATSENSENNGVSHALEHFLFKGSPKIKPGEFDRIHENLGAKINAWTSFDETCYWVMNMPKDALPEVIKTRGEVLQNAHIPQDEKEREEGPVIEEIKRNKNVKTNILQHKLLATVLKGTPYARTILGPAANIKRLTREEILDYKFQHYKPDNMSIIAVGDFDFESILGLIASSYNHPFPPTGPEFPATTGKSIEPVLKTKPRSEVKKLFDVIVGRKIAITDAFLRQGVQGPKPDQPGSVREVAALDFLSIIMGGGQSSRLYKKLVEEERPPLATSVGMGNWEFKQESLPVISTHTKPENLDRVKTLVREELDKVIREGVTEDEMEKVRNICETGLAGAAERNPGTVKYLAKVLSSGRFEETFGETGLALINSITAEEIQQAAEKYLKQENIHNIYLLPREFAKQYEEKLNSQQPGEPPKTEKRGKTRFSGCLNPKFDKSVILQGGTELIVREKPGGRNTAISVRIKGGNRANEGIAALTKYLADMLERGTTNQSAVEINKRLEDKALAMEIIPGLDSISLNLTGLTRHKDEMFSILADILNNPAFNQEDLDFVKTQFRSTHNSENKNRPNYVVGQLLAEAIYPENNVYGVSSQRILDTEEQVTPDKLKEVYSKLFSRPNITMAVVGGIPFDEACQQGEKLLNSLGDSPSEIPKVPAVEIKENRIVTRAMQEVAQAEVMRGWIAPSVEDKDRIPMEVLEYILSGGMSARLFQRFRETGEKGLCYTVNAGYTPTLEGGIFKFYIGTSPKNIMRVQTMFQEELDKLFNEPPTEEEMNRCKCNYKASLPLDESSTYGTSTSLTSHRGFDTDSMEEVLEKINAVTPEQVQTVARKYLMKPSVTAIVASKSALKKHKLPVNGEVKI